MEFTEKDRKLMLSIAKKLRQLELDIKNVKGNASTLHQPLKAPAVSIKVSPDIKPTTRVPVKKENEFGNSKVEIVFKDKRGNDPKQRVLVESLYRTLKELCVKNNIYTMNIIISNKN